MEVTAEASPNADPVRTLWRLARTSMTAVSSNEHLPIPDSGWAAEVFKTAVKRCQWSLGRTSPSRPIIRRRLGAPGCFGRLGPAQEIGVLKQLKTRQAQVRRFIKDNTQRNLLKQVRGSLPSVVSALNCYLQFRQLVAEDPFPAKERRAMERISVFNDTDTYHNYTQHMQKVCFFLGMSTDWYTPAVKHVAKGLKRRQDISSKFPNYVRARLLLRLIRSGPIQSEFAQACLIRFLFSFRVPPETLQMCRSYREDRLAEFSPQGKKAWIGVRLVKGYPFLAAKLSSRKNLTCGVIMTRPCFCGLDTDAARLVFPVHFLWPAVMDRVPCGKPLSKVSNRRNFNRTLKAIFCSDTGSSCGSLQLACL